MSKMDLSIVHPLDPTQLGVGGFDTCIHDFIRHAPEDWRIEVIGVAVDPERHPPGRRTEASVAGRVISFLPILAEPEPDVVRSVPLSLRFVAAGRLRRSWPAGCVQQFHRFESLFIRKWRGQRTSLFIHNDPARLLGQDGDVRWRQLRGLYWLTLRRALRQTDRIYAVDAETSSELEHRMGEDLPPIGRVPVWADPAVFEPLSTDTLKERRRAWVRELELRPTDPIVLFAGRMEGQKNLSMLIRAAGVSRELGEPISLLLVGKGREQGMLRKLVAELELGATIRFLDPVPRARLGELYNVADAVACSSHFESGPRHIIEALACGTPVVSTAVGLVTEVLAVESHVGALAAEPTPLALAQAMRSVLEKGKGERLRTDCVRSVSAFTPQRVLAPLYRQYNSWMGEQVSGSAVEGERT